MPAKKKPVRKAAKAPAGKKKATAKRKKAAPRKAAPKAKKAAAKKKATAALKKAAPTAKKKPAKAKSPAKKKGAKTTQASTEPEATPQAASVPATGEAASGADTVQEGAAAETAAPPEPRPIPPMPPRRADGTVTVAYSPDADDAFMFYALVNGKVDTEDRRYDLVQDEIQTLNQKAREGVYDVTAISFGAYPYLYDRYLLLSCGASFGDGRGPILVSKTPIRTNEVNGLTVAVPGLLTTAALALRIWLPHARLDLREYGFDAVIAAVHQGRTRAGVLIHERQLTWREENLIRIVDFGQWWNEKTEGLPLPLGANAIRRDIDPDERAKIALDIKRSIAYGLGHREEALDYAMQFAKGLSRKIVERYVGMYVNELALDYAERGRQAVRTFLDEARQHGFIPEALEPEFG